MYKKIWSNSFLVSFIIIVIIIFSHFISFLRPLENLTSFVFRPFQSLGYKISNNITQNFAEKRERQELEKENQDLRRKINDLDQKIVNLKIFIEEKEIVTDQNNFLTSRDFNFVNTKIISKNVDNNPNLLLIDKGIKSGIREGMPVVVEKGVLIGKIIKANQMNSHVLLVVDDSSKLSASISRDSKVLGIVEGKHNLSLSFDYLLKNTDIKKGDLVVTSGFDAFVPAGLLLGEVSKIIDDPDSLFKRTDIVSEVNFKNLRILSVILN